MELEDIAKIKSKVLSIFILLLKIVIVTISKG